MTPLNFVSQLSTVPHQLLGITSLSILSSDTDRSVVTVALSSATNLNMFLMNVANRFVQLSPSIDIDDTGRSTTLVLGDLKISATSSAPGRCHFTVQLAN